MLRLPLEENARLYAVSRSILLDENAEYSPSSNPDFEKRRREIQKNHDRAIEKIFRQISLDDLKEIKQDNHIDAVRNMLSDALLYDQDNNLLFFEMGMRCGFVLLSDLTDTEGTIADLTPEPEGAEPPKIEDILQKDPATLTHEEMTILNAALDIPTVMDYYGSIPPERRDEYRFIERMNRYYEIEYKDGKMTEFREKPSKLGDFGHLSPEEIRRLKIKRNYLDFHRMHVQEWCRKNGVLYTKAED